MHASIYTKILFIINVLIKDSKHQFTYYTNARYYIIICVNINNHFMQISCNLLTRYYLKIWIEPFYITVGQPSSFYTKQIYFVSRG